MFTRSDYLAPFVSKEDSAARFRRYYGEIIEAMGGARTIRLPFSIERIRAALAAGDEHLNTLPLAQWDAATHALRSDKALRDRGDYPTLGSGVCILKEAARLQAEMEGRAP